MISVKLRSATHVDGWELELPAVPRRGDFLELETKQYRVMKVIFTEGYTTITLEIELA